MINPFKMFNEQGSYTNYNEGDIVTYSNSLWVASSNVQIGRIPSESGSGWTKSRSGDITGISITADAGLTGSMTTYDGFHYQDLTIATGGITTAHIADNAITSSKIADGAILGVDVATGVTLIQPDITGDAEVFGNVYITGTAGGLNNAFDPVLTIKYPTGNRYVAIEASGGISMGSSEVKAKKLTAISGISGQSGSFARVISTGLISGYTGEFTDIISVKGISSQGGLIDGYTGDFNQVVANSGITAKGISTDNIHVKSGISAGGLVKGYTGEFTDIISVNGLSAHAGLVKGKTGEFNELVAISGISCGGDIQVNGDIVMKEDETIKIGGDTEHIAFNGDGAEINIRANELSIDRYLQHFGDSNTHLEFQTDQITLAAGGTDYIDITSAGTNFADTDVVRPKLKDYSETVHAVGNVNSSTAFDFENGNVQTVTVAGIDTGSTITFSLSNPPASGIAGTMTVIFTNGNAHGDVAFHSSIKWPSDVAPSLTASGVDVISFLTTDGGTTYYGFVGGLNFS